MHDLMSHSSSIMSRLPSTGIRSSHQCVWRNQRRNSSLSSLRRQGRRCSVTVAGVKEIFMPALSSTMTEGKIVSWLKTPGDKVAKGESVVSVIPYKPSSHLNYSFSSFNPLDYSLSLFFVLLSSPILTFPSLNLWRQNMAGLDHESSLFPPGMSYAKIWKRNWEKAFTSNIFTVLCLAMNTSTCTCLL